MDDNIEPAVNILNVGEVEPVFVDWFLTVGSYDGTVTATLGSLDPMQNTETHQSVRVGVSMKMSVAFAERFSELLRNVVADAKKSEAETGHVPLTETPQT